MDEKQEPWRGKHYSFFQNTQCEFFPCHKTDDPEAFNCIFCYCPLYALGPDCGGQFSYLEGGIKNCSRCLLPHQPENYGYVTKKYRQIAERMKQWEEKDK